MKVLVVFIVILFFVVLFEILRELSSFQTIHYNICIQGLEISKKAVFLSDMHNHIYGKENVELYEEIKKQEPDIILIGGDMLVGKEKETYEKALGFVKKLPEIAPVYYANGNHEQRMKESPEEYMVSYEDYHNQLLKAGVHFVENESASFRWGDKRITITGLEIPLRCYSHFHKEKLEIDEITDRIGSKKTESYEILLAHNPSYVKEYIQRGADLILSGHLHGGIVRIPGLVGAISPSFELFPKYSGDYYKVNDTDVVVSKGLGTHTINIRFMNPAELVVLNFHGENLV